MPITPCPMRPTALEIDFAQVTATAHRPSLSRAVSPWRDCVLFSIASLAGDTDVEARAKDGWQQKKAGARR
jgi:hypothetical protein